MLAGSSEESSLSGSQVSTSSRILRVFNALLPLSNTSVAVSAWTQTMVPYHNQGKTLVSPAVSRSDPNQPVPGSGLDWLYQFMAACPDTTCFIDEIALHWFASSLAFNLSKTNKTAGWQVWRLNREQRLQDLLLYNSRKVR